MIDNYCTGSNGFIGKRLMERLRGNTAAIPHRQITDMVFEPFRRFFYLSAYGNMAGQQDVVEMVRANVRNVAYVLNRILSLGLQPESFLFVSSSSVTLPVQTPYSRTKRAAEELLLALPLPVCIVRPYSCTGVGEQREHLIPTLIRSCMEGTLMDFVPDATHDYIDVEDVVEGLIHLAKNQRMGVYEFGSGKPTSNEEVLALVEMACGKSANITRVDSLRDYDSPDWYCKKPSWIAKKQLEQTVSEMVNAYRK